MDNRILRKRTILVIIITVLMMLAEIYYGLTSNSMALTADGFHMGTHAVAFIITLIVCIIAIEHEEKAEKFNAIGGLISAILLGLTAIGIVWESVERFIFPLSITFEEAILVAIIGLVVNILCIFIMGGDFHIHLTGDINHEHCGCHHNHAENHHHENKTENLNFKAAYLHIIADAMTSVLAIGALILAKFLGLIFLDSIIGCVGGFVIFKWAIDLIKSSYKILKA